MSLVVTSSIWTDVIQLLSHHNQNYGNVFPPYVEQLDEVAVAQVLQCSDLKWLLSSLNKDLAQVGLAQSSTQIQKYSICLNRSTPRFTSHHLSYCLLSTLRLELVSMGTWLQYSQTSIVRGGTRFQKIFRVVTSEEVDQILTSIYS
jgi:hypothetical protein